MERIVTRFVTALREEGIRVSPGEALDAVRAIALGGVAKRGAAKSLLRMTLVKRAADFPIFDLVFDNFFSVSEGSEDGAGLDELLDVAITCFEEGARAFEAHIHPDEDRVKFQVEGTYNPGDKLEMDSLTEAPAGELESAEIMVQLKGYRGQRDPSKPSQRQWQDTNAIRLKVERRQDMCFTFTDEELTAMEDVVSRMIHRLKKDVRRNRARQRRGKLHVIKTIQRNYRHGMVPFLLSLRRRRKERPRIVVLCDVSYSVSHASRFMLLLLQTLHKRLMEVRSFIFNREVEEITDLLTNMPINSILEDIDEGNIVDLDENSDYGHAFVAFKEKYLQSLRGKPAIIILGDGRNNYQEPNDAALGEITERAGYTLWLTPEARDLWDLGDCLIELYGSYCDRVEVAGKVEELSRFVEELFRSFYADQYNRDRGKIRFEAKAQAPYEYGTYYARRKKSPPLNNL
jgi:uncharacterized protein with von Willebrand factor type A (vWA) domain